MQFQGIGREEHDAQIHRVTKCMYDHSGARTSGGAAKTASADQAQAQLQPQLEGFSLSAWLEKYLSGGKSLLRGVWTGGGTSAGGAEDGSGQVPAQMWEDRGTDAAGARGNGADPVQASWPAAALQQAAAAVPVPSAQGAPALTAGAGVQEESLWQKARVCFQGIAGQLTGHLRGNASSPRKKNAFHTREQERHKEEPKRSARAKKDAVEIDSHRAEESYLLDSYDRKGSYSKLSAKK